MDNENPDKKNNKGDTLKPDILAGFFESANNISCIILNFCYSKPAAELIAKSTRVPCVIGIEGRIEIQASTDFASSFYKALKGKVISYTVLKDAIDKGKVATNDRRKEGEYHIIHQNPEMQIKIPEDGNKVPYPCECSGTFKNLYEGSSMWAYVNATIEGKFYVVPINNYTNRSINGEWRVPLYIGSPEGDNNDYRIGVFMVNPETTSGFKSEYSKAVKEQGYWALDRLPTTGVEFSSDECTVKRQ